MAKSAYIHAHKPIPAQQYVKSKATLNVYIVCEKKQIQSQNPCMYICTHMYKFHGAIIRIARVHIGVSEREFENSLKR